MCIYLDERPRRSRLGCSVVVRRQVPLVQIDGDEVQVRGHLVQGRPDGVAVRRAATRDRIAAFVLVKDRLRPEQGPELR